MKIKRWVDKRGTQYWVKDKNGVARQMIFGAKKNNKSKIELPDYIIHHTTRTREWIMEHYGIKV